MNRPRHREITESSLRRTPLPSLDADGDKEERGRVLVIGGSRQVAGAMLLAGVAALRAGAGKLQMATVASAAIPLGMSVPEALVIALPESRAGEIAGRRAAPLLRAHVSTADAILAGPGLSASAGTNAMIGALARMVAANATLVLDAGALMALRDDGALLASLEGRAVLTPHAGEMASLLGITKREVEREAPAVARESAARFGAVVVLKGSESWIAEPGGTLARYAQGTVGLATSGSGDTLAGIVAGLAARGASPMLAACWAVWAHGSAGRVLARRMGEVGFLARELLQEVPSLLARRTRK
ncbi:MAG: NAD(P)H-hydrate dehydratase [Gemmatimonadetes bacterium]|nr:NAD(P)H-hydrate dehydratase [Gemmatimonadota bacterium]